MPQPTTRIALRPGSIKARVPRPLTPAERATFGFATDEALAALGQMFSPPARRPRTVRPRPTCNGWS